MKTRNRKIAFLLFFMAAAVLLSGCGSSKPSKTQLETAVNTALQSSENPLKSRYVQYEYIQRISELAVPYYTATFDVTESSEHSRVELVVVASWYREGRNWLLESAYIESATAHPFSSPEKSLFELGVRADFVETNCLDWQLDIMSHSRQPGAAADTVVLRLVRTYDLFRQTLSLQADAVWDMWEECWTLGKGSDSFEVSEVDYDFSQLNGRWEGIWSSYDHIPIWFEISGAGTVNIPGGDRVGTRLKVNVEHNLNEVLNDNTLSVFYSQFDSGEMYMEVDYRAEEPRAYITIQYPGDLSGLKDSDLQIIPEGLDYVDIFRTHLSCINTRADWPPVAAVEATPAPATAPPAAETPSKPEGGMQPSFFDWVATLAEDSPLYLVFGALILILLGLVIYLIASAARQRRSPAPGRRWLCPGCGARNRELYCSKCGRYRFAAEPDIKASSGYAGRAAARIDETVPVKTPERPRIKTTFSAAGEVARDAHSALKGPDVWEDESRSFFSPASLEGDAAPPSPPTPVCWESHAGIKISLSRKTAREESKGPDAD